MKKKKKKLKEIDVDNNKTKKVKEPKVKFGSLTLRYHQVDVDNRYLIVEHNGKEMCRVPKPLWEGISDSICDFLKEIKEYDRHLESIEEEGSKE
jgi:hypothetical protein